MRSGLRDATRSLPRLIEQRFGSVALEELTVEQLVEQLDELFEISRILEGEVFRLVLKHEIRRAASCVVTGCRVSLHQA
jgi:hypothetical protein